MVSPESPAQVRVLTYGAPASRSRTVMSRAPGGDVPGEVATVVLAGALGDTGQALDVMRHPLVRPPDAVPGVPGGCAAGPE